MAEGAENVLAHPMPDEGVRALARTGRGRVSDHVEAAADHHPRVADPDRVEIGLDYTGFVRQVGGLDHVEIGKNHSRLVRQDGDLDLCRSADPVPVVVEVAGRLVVDDAV